MQQIRGVNLGGWLVLERWITPSLFEGSDATDEYTLCQAGGDVAKERIQKHRETFITKDTIKAIAERGLNTVRLPVGHWLFGDKTVLRGLEVLNEPHWDVPMKTLLEYYQQTYDLIRGRYPDLTILMSDAFRPEEMAKQLQKRRFTGVMLDVHLYQLFTPEDRALDLHGHIRKTERDWAKLLGKLTKRMPVIVGEWSAAMHELYLPLDQPAHTKRYGQNDYRTYFQAQHNMFNERAVSWTYWTARTERGGPWSLLDNPDFW